jgi:hypothetical protein
VGLFGAEAVGPGTASLLRRSPGGSFFVLDFRQGQIREIDPVTDRSRVWVQASPPPLDFDFLPSGALLWIRDSEPILHLQASFGAPDGTFPWPETLSRLVSEPEGGLVGSGDGEARSLFRRYSPEGLRLGAYGRFLAGDHQDTQVLEGALAADGAGGFFYAPHYLPFLARFTFDGRLSFVEPLAGIKAGTQLAAPPRIVRGPRDSRNIEPGTRVRTYSMHLSDDHMALLAELSPERQRVLDLYRVEDGAYEESLELPAGTRDAHLAGSELYTLHRDGIRRWHLEDRHVAEPAGDAPPGRTASAAVTR